jgi:1-acyl-sn-glycerol-3-phosphate acyltransferase
MYALMRGVMRLMVSVYLDGLFRVINQDRMPRTGGVLVCSNHASTIDPPLVPAYLPRTDSWTMAKSEYFIKAVARWIFEQYHAFPVVRHSADRAALNRSRDILKRGEVLIVYPEGTRVTEGGLKAAEPGAGFIARMSGAAVQPVALVGTRDCFPKGARWPRRVSVEMRFGRLLRIRDKRPDGRNVENQEAADAIMLAIAEELPAPMRGEFADLDGLRARLAGVWEPVADGCDGRPAGTAP